MPKQGVVVVADGEEVSLAVDNAVYPSLIWGLNRLDLLRLYSSHLVLENRASSEL